MNTAPSDELITRAYLSLVKLRASHVDPATKIEINRRMMSILQDERFLHGEEHVAKRFLATGKVVRVEYSTEALESFISQILQLVEKYAN